VSSPRKYESRKHDDRKRSRERDHKHRRRYSSSSDEAGITAILLVGTETVEIKKIVDIDDLLLPTVATVSIITASK
jgi:hypothetical protein